ncbi:hypothetical protein SAY87_005642 [Trapa incisa]|nr:hypothetical protein SAY87_005642 [Trapa incisa]
MYVPYEDGDETDYAQLSLFFSFEEARGPITWSNSSGVQEGEVDRDVDEAACSSVGYAKVPEVEDS